MKAKIQRIWVEGPLPGLNEMIASAKKRSKGTKWNAYAALKKKWTVHLSFIFKAELRPVRTAYVVFGWVEKNKRRDPDNIAAGGRKILLDSLVHAGIIKDDNWKYIDGFEDTFEVGHKAGVMLNIIGKIEKGNGK